MLQVTFLMSETVLIKCGFLIKFVWKTADAKRYLQDPAFLLKRVILYTIIVTPLFALPNAFLIT